MIKRITLSRRQIHNSLGSKHLYAYVSCDMRNCGQILLLAVGRFSMGLEPFSFLSCATSLAATSDSQIASMVCVSLSCVITANTFISGWYHIGLIIERICFHILREFRAEELFSLADIVHDSMPAALHEKINGPGIILCALPLPPKEFFHKSQPPDPCYIVKIRRQFGTNSNKQTNKPQNLKNWLPNKIGYITFFSVCSIYHDIYSSLNPFRKTTHDTRLVAFQRNSRWFKVCLLQVQSPCGRFKAFLMKA